MAQNEVHILREWAPLTDLYNKLPIRTQNGIFSQEIKMTCIDILPEFLAIGTNVGIVYWYDRKKKDLQRLRCENSNVNVTVVKVISTVDYMVACGNNLGNISIFQIPKTHPDTIPDNLKPKKQQVERYTVSELHKCAISAIEWSKNGMKLFSGDKNGCVVLTEIDFYMHICKSLEILNESYEVVQLSYCQQRLLVSTIYRSIICQKQDKWKVCQVGKKDRKILGAFGGTIIANGFKTSDINLYCTRPGLRIWEADIEGNVLKTLLFKDLLSKECPEVPIINPISRNLRSLKPQKEPSFGVLLQFDDNLLITYNNDVVYILDPQKMSILSTISHLRNVLSVSTYKDEIFILEEERSLIRISYKPEQISSPNPYNTIGTSFLPITTSIKDIKTKLQSTTILPAIPPLLENAFQSPTVDVHTDETLIMNAEEAKESPIKVRQHISEEVQKKFDDIGKQEFNDKILFKKSKKKKATSSGTSMNASTLSLSSNSSEDREMYYTQPTLMNLSTVGVLPDLRSPESIKNDIEYKEKILADVLNLGKVKINLDDINETKHDNALDKDTIIEENRAVVEEKINLQQPVSSQTSNTNNVKSKVNNSKVFNDTPALVTIPNDWKLIDIKLMDRNDSVVSDSSLNDWEII